MPNVVDAPSSVTVSLMLLSVSTAAEICLVMQTRPRSSLTSSLNSAHGSRERMADSSPHESSSPAGTPAHPWSVANPRFLPSAQGAQPAVPTVSASAAAAPVGMPPATAGDSAIPVSDPAAGAAPPTFKLACSQMTNAAWACLAGRRRYLP